MIKIHRSIIILIYLLSIPILFLLTSCAYDPVSDRHDFNIVSEKEEQKIGDQAHPEICKEFGVYSDQALQEYVTSVGQEITSVSARKGVVYQFTVLDSSIINAFALPGGYIYITRGTLAQMNSEAELAFVLGHEVSHVAARHSAERLSQGRTLQAANVLATILLNQKLGSAGDVANLGANLMMLGYGRGNEHEADLIGVDYAVDAGYDPYAGARFLYTLKRQEKYEKKGLEWMTRTHPPTVDRIKKADEKAKETLVRSGRALDQLRIEKEEFLEKIQGIYIGETPSLGAMKDDSRIYSNARYGFKFTVPANWTFIDPIKGEVIMLEAPASSVGLRASVKLVKLNGRPWKDYLKEIRVSVSGLKEEKSFGNQSGEQLTYFSGADYDQFYLKADQEALVLTFYYQKESDQEGLPGVVQKFAETFSSLPKKDRGYLLKLYRSKPGDTPLSIAESVQKDKDWAERLMAFNDLDSELVTPTSNLKPNTLLKLPAH